MIRLKTLRKEIVKVCRLMYERGFICATDGNVSIKFQENEILITPSGTHKGLLTEDDIVMTDLQGNLISGNKKPSSEIMMHLKVYNACEGINAVIHAHPPICTAISLTDAVLSTKYTPEVYITFGDSIPIAPYATPSTKEVPDSIADYLPEHRAIILSHHGSLTMGKSLWEAFYRLEKMENAAYVYLLAKQFGKPEPISEEKLKLLERLRQ